MPDTPITTGLRRMLREKIANHLCLGEDEITDDADLFMDLGADSLDAVTLVVDIEEALEIEIPDDQLDGLRTLAQFTTAAAEALGLPPEEGA